MASPSELKAFLRERQRSSLAEIAVHFDTSPDAARASIEPWLDKGKVRRVAAEGNSCGGSCGKSCCDGGSLTEIYEWVGS